MFNTSPKFPKTSKATWQSVLANPLIFGVMIIFPLDSKSTLALVSASLMFVASGLSPLQIPRIRFSASIACGIISIFGCGVGGFALANILEHLFPDFPTVKQWAWMESVPSAFANLAILVWIFVVLNIAPVNYALIVSTGFVAAAAGYALTLDVFVLREAFVFDSLREITGVEKGGATLLYGCAVVVWERLIVRKMIAFSMTKSMGGINLICWRHVNLIRNFYDSTEYFLTHNFLVINFTAVYYIGKSYQLQV